MILLLILLVFTDSIAKQHLEKGRIKKAIEICKKDTIGCSNFVNAEIAYFNYRFKDALDLYYKVPPHSKDANNALSRVILIKENDYRELEKYVNAELQGRQGKIKEGILRLKKLQKTASPIAIYASILLIDFLKKENRLEEAIKECEVFIKKYSSHRKLPHVKLEMGKLYIVLGNEEEARKIYRQILLKYPFSSVAPIAKEELEAL
jgi:tetratricopeptide (TPR) repeat protein